ncbi:uncharacterized protein LOC128602585 [Ictalurus furcatus]|uniref:uncharacterized protein LOC128602585 n=1 Tax=Ictalurus furcatus TaxID=66913 RepID=UPI0023501FAB|nr:uncharacterized protein LOC128602585 [Ictalurus furcatus]
MEDKSYLQVKVDPNTVGQRELKLTCSATCSLSTYRFYWYRNGQYEQYITEASIVIDSTHLSNLGSYSCQVYESQHRSPPACVLGKECWGVTYTPERVCALKDTSIDLSCSYKHPAGHTVIKSVWFIKDQTGVEPVDVREDEEYQGRVQYTQNSQNNCRLRITNLRERDAQTYRFRFYTDGGKYTGDPGVSLSVTDMKVIVSDSDNWNKRLSCITTCTLSNNPTYIWYKNGQRVTDPYRNELYVSSWESGSYSCAVRGHEELRSPAVCVFDEKSCWSVTYSTQTICSLIGSSVDIHSYYTFPDRYKVTEVFWFIKEQAGVEPVDVREDEEYRGRVQYTQISQNNCRLRITNLRERDAQTYRFRFYTDDPTGEYTGDPGVSLSVTDLKVTVSDWYTKNSKKLSCITTCTLSNNPTYIWYKNGQRVTDPYRNELYVSSGESGSYSCAVRGHEELRSPAVCVLGKECWGVTYTPERVCALKDTSIDLSCSYKHPAGHTVIKSVWFIKDQTGVEPVDVREDEEYQGRVQYTQNSQNNCRLRITNLRERDAQTYRFRFYTDGGNYTGDPGVSLSVTDLKVIVSDSGSWNKRLSCITTCTLSNNPTYIWYKNGQRVTDPYRNELYVSSGESGSYSCAVRGHEELRSPAVCVFDEKSCWSVTYSTQTICSLIGSSVDIHSYYTFPNRYKVTEVFWFIKEQAGVEPVDVREDEEYQGRVQYTQISQNNCRLRITNLRERDAQTYRFTFYTDDPTGKYTGDPGVFLSVTDLKVIVSDSGSWNKKLSCITTCTLSNNPTYIWYKNGQRVTDRYINELDVKIEESGSYSCAVRGHEELRSPAVCVFDEKSCWSVTYSTQTICSLIGSSVDIHSYYTFPNRYKVTEVFWFIKDQTGVEPVDVREDEEYRGRVQHTQISQNNCRLRITNLRERDAQTYRFTFYTDDPTGKYTGDPGVSLSVTDLKVIVSDWSEQYMNLSCITTCTLSNNPTYIWYKNRQRVSECKSASCSVAAVGGAVSYSCAVEGHDSLLSPPVYSPKNTRAVVLSSGDTVEGDSVTLSCSSDANPPVLTYSWFKQRAAADTLLTTGQNYSISNISSQHSGLYYCTAHNQLGQHNSTPTLLDVKGNSTQTHLDVLYSPRNRPVILSMSGDYYCTASNGFGSSSSSEWEHTSDNSVVKYAVSGVTVALVLSFIAVFLWIRRGASSFSNSSVEYSKNDSASAYGNVSAMTSDPSQTASSEDQDIVQLPLNSKALNQKEEVEHATLRLVKSRAVR